MCLFIHNYRGLYVPEAGIEPARAHAHRFLRPTRLPIPPLGPEINIQGGKDSIFYLYPTPLEVKLHSLVD